MNSQSITPSLLARTRHRFTNFFTAPASPLPLSVLRIGVAGVLLLQAISLAGDVQQLFGERAIVQWSAVIGSSMHPLVPHVGWLVEFLGPYGVSPAQCVQGVFIAYILGLSCLLIGWRTHLAAIVAWITHLALNSSGDMTIYGVDQFANIALFYLTWVPSGGALSLDQSAGRTSSQPSVMARIGLRTVQLHLCISYLASGIEKASGIQWRNGEAIWRVVNLPELAQFNMTWLASVPLLAILLCWGTLFIEIGYTFLILPKKTRKLMALATISLHVGIALFMGLVSFSAFMSVLTFSVFMIGSEPHIPGAPTGLKAWLYDVLPISLELSKATVTQ